MNKQDLEEQIHNLKIGETIEFIYPAVPKEEIESHKIVLQRIDESEDADIEDMIVNYLEKRGYRVEYEG